MIQTDTISEIQLVYKPSISNKPIINSPLDGYNVFIDFYPKDTLHLQEHFFVAYLNRFNRVLGVLHLSSGGITGTIADIRLIFGTALKAAASSILISHNHPSGQLKPSDRDRDVTKKIRDAGDMLDIKLLDHIIVGHEGHYLSFSDEGL
jgi:DNA repair protein RadC